MKIGRMARGKKYDSIVKLDSMAVSIEGMRRSRSHAYACRIKAKKTTAMEKPTICTNITPDFSTIASEQRERERERE